MAISTKIKNYINSSLRPLNIRLETLTAEKIEQSRIEFQKSLGHFAQPVFPILPGIMQLDLTKIFQEFDGSFTNITEIALPPVGGLTFQNNNNYFKTPDAEILYLILGAYKPKRWIEIGSGNSTLLLRQTIIHKELDTHVTAIDPNPRTDISNLANKIYYENIEYISDSIRFEELEPGDVLFIDSSHEINVANDVVNIFLNVLPRLSKGVLVHIHDIFLPYDYPIEWIERSFGWQEQYLLQSILYYGEKKILWPGYYLQMNKPELSKDFPFLGSGRAQSFWFEI